MSGGEQAVDSVEIAAVASATGMQADGLARIPVSYPTYAEVLVDASLAVARQLNLKIGWQAQAAHSIS